MKQTVSRFDNSSGVTTAKSRATTVIEAAAEIAARLPADGLAMVLVFLSPYYDPERFVAEMTAHFGETPIYGCTTAGELTPDGCEENSVVALAFSANDFNVVARPIVNLARFSNEEGRKIGSELQQELLRRDSDVEVRQSFGLVLIDGMCRREEAIMSAINASLDNIPIVGGAAGDGLRFERTWVFFNGRAHTDAAVLMLLSTSLPFRLFTCDNLEPTSTKMVVTEADIEQRVVKELNGEPAVEEYSRAVGISDDGLDAFSFASHPVLVKVGRAHYARSIQQARPDGSLSFFCAIDEGIVFTVAKSYNPVSATREVFARLHDEIGEVSIYIGFECISRRFAAKQHQVAREMSELYRENRVIGFHTYGEQYGSMHMSHTLTGVAIGRRRAREMWKRGKLGTGGVNARPLS